MIVSKENPNKGSKYKLTPAKAMLTAGVCCVPYITTTGDVLIKTIDNYKADKTTIKDAFVKAVKQAGTVAQEFLKSLKKVSPITVGASVICLGSLIDVLLTYFCVSTLAEKLKK